MRTRKKRYNLMLDPDLHAWAMQQADKEGKSFSGYVSDLLQAVSDRGRGEVKMTRSERDELRREVSQEVLSTLLKRKSGL